MKVVSFNIPKTYSEGIHLQRDEVSHLYDHLHRHKEIQITAIVQSEGTIIAGNYIGRFSAGDVFILGSDLPHVFRNDEPYYHSDNLSAISLSVFFDMGLMGEQFWTVDETKVLKDFLTKTRSGFRVIGTTRNRIFEKICQIFSNDILEKFISCFQIFQILLSSTELLQLSFGEIAPYSEAEGTRMNDIIRYTFRENHRKISITEIAGVAHLTPEAFCRYFKQHTRKTYTQYLNEIRISNACKLLLQNTGNIAFVSDATGFQNLSHFNRVFKKLTGFTPRAYIQLNNTTKPAIVGEIIHE